MANPQPITFTIVFLNTLSTRLIDHADSITNVAGHDMEIDIRLASRVCGCLAGLRFCVAEIAEMALEQDGGATRRDLLDALTDAEV